MRFFFDLNMDNAAFDPDYSVELVKQLRKTAARIEADPVNERWGHLVDSNGNRVGKFEIGD